MSYQGYPDGLYLVAQRSAAKGVDHYGILDIENRRGAPNEGHGLPPVIIHQSPPYIRAGWLQDTGEWRVLYKIEHEGDAIERLRVAFVDPVYTLLGHNCEHFARFVATGVRESRQLQAAGWVLVIAASNAEPQHPRRRSRRKRLSLARVA